MIDWRIDPDDHPAHTDDTIRRQLAEHADLLPIAGGGDTTRHVLGELRRHGPATALMVATSVAAAAFAAWLPRLVGSAVDVVTGSGDTRDLWRLAGLIAAAGVAQAILSALAWAQVGSLGQRVLAGMREAVIDRALDLPAQTMERAGIGDALSRVADDVDVAAKAVTNVVPELIRTGFLIVVSLVGMVALSPWLLVMLLVTLPLYVLAGRWYLPRAAAIYRRERVAMGARAQGLLSAIHGAPTVHAYGIEDREIRHVSVLSQAAANLNLRVIVLIVRTVRGVNVPENLSIVGVLLAGYVMVRSGQPAGTVTAACLYLTSLTWPLMQTLFNLDEIQSAGASLTRMVGVIRSVDPAHSPGPQVPADGSVVLAGVSHAYRATDDGTEDVVLHPVDLRIEDGTRVALVGGSGAGKSTLAAVIAGTLTPRHGRVLHGGADLARADLAAIRRHAGIVTQDVHVFRGALADDLRLVRPDASTDELHDSLDRAGALQWVQGLPAGLDTVVGEKGVRLSAEQSQQLALARIALRDPAILILDEATADEGSAGARTLESAAAEVARGRTTVVVAHRLSQARDADRILVMEGGRVVEQGTHDELVVLGGAYADLWGAWSGA